LEEDSRKTGMSLRWFSLQLLRSLFLFSFHIEEVENFLRDYCKPCTEMCWKEKKETLWKNLKITIPASFT
jgi:hypothetical protein